MSFDHPPKGRPLFDKASGSNQSEDRFRGGTDPLPLAEEFRIITDGRKQIVARIKELQPEVSNRERVRTLGMHHDTR